MRIDRATPADVAAAEDLLEEAGLPTEGARAALELGVVAFEADRVVAAAGLERYGDAGLLRSVVVAAGCRGRGVGRAVVAATERLAAAEGMRELYLLTETAADWFRGLGYEPVPRTEAAAVVGRSVEFTTVCRDRGVAMRRSLPPP